MGWLEVASIAAPFVSNLLGQNSARETNEKQIDLSRDQMAFQERMSNTSYQRAVADLKAAGLNPMLAYGQGGASTPSGAMPVLANPAIAGFQGATSAAQISQLIQAVSKTEAETKNVEMDTQVKEGMLVVQAAQAKQLLSSSGQLEALTKQVEVQSRKIEQEIAKLVQETNTETWEALIRKLKHSEVSETYGDRIKQIVAEAEKVKFLSMITGHQLPEAINKAAFEKSELGQSSRYVDFLTNQSGKLGGSAIDALDLFRKFKGLRYYKGKPQ